MPGNVASVLVTLQNLSWIRYDVTGAFCKKTSPAGVVYMINWKISRDVPKEVLSIEYTRRTGEVLILPRTKLD
jgi:hypothetical protein